MHFLDRELHRTPYSPAQRSACLPTGHSERVLGEAGPADRVWGIGLAADDAHASDPTRWRGLDLLGFALMEVPDALRDQRSPK